MSLADETRLVKDIASLKSQKRQLQSLKCNQDDVRLHTILSQVHIFSLTHCQRQRLMPSARTHSTFLTSSTDWPLQIDRDKEDKSRVGAELKAKRDEFGRILAQLNAQREVRPSSARIVCRH